MAMMLLGFRGDGIAVANAYAQVEELILRHDLGAILECQSQMVYHTGFGNLDVGVEAARQLIEEQGRRGNIADLFRGYCNSAVTFRVAGLFEEATKSLEKALELAERYGLDQSIVRVIPMLANVALECGRTDDARKWYTRLSEVPIHQSDRFGILECGGIGARLALLDGDAKAALERWAVTREQAQTDRIYHRRAYNCALQVAIDLALEGMPNSQTLACLLDAYEHSKTGLHQAYSVCVIYAALIRLGQPDHAENLFEDYGRNHRREPWPVPQHLIESVLSLGREASRLAG